MQIHEPLIRYAKFRVALVPGMLGASSPPPRVSDPDMRHVICVTHMQWFMPGLLTIGFRWSRWQGERSRHSQCERNLLFCVSGKRPMEYYERCIIRYIEICTRGTFHWRYFALNSNSRETSPCCNSIVCHQIARLFCTCHVSRAVEPCSKFCCDHYVKIEVRVKRNFKWIWIAM